MIGIYAPGDFHHTCSIQHVPPTFALNQFLPLLALLLHQIELLMPQDDPEGADRDISIGLSHSPLTAHSKKQMATSYMTMEKFNR